MATVSTAPAPGMHQIDLSKLNLQQLAQLKQRLDQVSNETLLIFYIICCVIFRSLHILNASD